MSVHVLVHKQWRVKVPWPNDFRWSIVWASTQPFFTLEVLDELGFEPGSANLQVSTSSCSTNNVLKFENCSIQYYCWWLVGGKFNNIYMKVDLGIWSINKSIVWRDYPICQSKSKTTLLTVLLLAYFSLVKNPFNCDCKLVYSIT